MVHCDVNQLYVGRGKRGQALIDFKKRIKRAKKTI